MAAQTEERKVKIILDGKQADASLKQMEASAAVLWNQLKKLPPTSDEFTNKKVEYQKLRERIKETKGEIFNTSGALDSAKASSLGFIDTFADYIPFGGQLRNIVSTFGNWRSAIDLNVKGFRLLKVAIASTGIGALIVVLGSLIEYLTGTQAGMDAVTKITRPLFAVFDKLRGLVQNLGGSVFKGLAQILSGDIKEGLQTLGSGIKEAVTNIDDAIVDGIEAGTKLDQLQKSIEKTEIALIERRAELNAVYQENKEIAQDVARSEEERLAAAQKAQEAQNTLLSEEQAFLDQKIEQLELQQSLNDTSREDEKELSQLRAERINFEANAARRRASARALENSINKQVEAEEAKAAKEKEAREKKAADEAKKRLDERQKALERYNDANIKSGQAIADLRVELMEEGLGKELAALDVAHDKELQSLDDQRAAIVEDEKLTQQEKADVLSMFAEQERLLTADLEKKKQQVREEAQEKYAQSVRDSEIAIAQLRVELLEDGLDKELAKLNLAHEQELTELEEQRSAILESETLTQEQKLELLAQFSERERLLNEELEQQREEARQEKREEDREKQLEELDEDSEIRQAKLQELFERAVITEQERDLQLLDLQWATALERLRILQQTNQTETAEYQKLKTEVARIFKRGKESIRNARKNV